jgi:hypothetical protein
MLYWFSKEAPRLIIPTRASEVDIQYEVIIKPPTFHNNAHKTFIRAYVVYTFMFQLV